MKKEFTKSISPDNNDRLRIRIDTEKGTVIRIMVQYESFIEQKWREIVRYDCSHGFLHRDIIFPKKVEKQPLKIDNLKDALQYAEQDIKDRWKWYRERYKRRLKNEKR